MIFSKLILKMQKSIAIEAARLRCKYVDLPSADAVIAATSINSSSNFILTDDKHIKQIKETQNQVDVKENWDWINLPH